MQKPFALITGGSRGLGWHLINELSKNSYAVAYISRQPAKDSFGAGNVIYIPGDLDSSEEIIDPLKQVLQKPGSLNVFIHNAATAADALLYKQTVENWERVMRLNFRSLTVLWEILFPLFPENGSVALIGSWIARNGNIGQSFYGASKGLLIDFMRYWARPLGRKKCRINVIHPGYMDTDLSRPSQPRSLEKALAQSCLNQVGDKARVAEWIIQQVLTPGLSGQVLQYDSRE
jgi:3-oxoacyl-[acyl-carrier protein] reductase